MHEAAEAGLISLWICRS